VFTGDRPVVSERAANPDEAAKIAERLWAMLVEHA
jgi:hypothetical protein